jgi:dUTP pyrophosphatase
MIQVKLLSEGAKVPTKANESDAGFDLYCTVDAEILPGQRKLLPTGISMAIPVGYYGRIADRSGNSFSLGLHVLAGVVDSGYRAEVKVLLVNLSEVPVEIKRGHRVAQLIITAISTLPLMQVQELDSTDRGASGFGSSGR